MDKMDSTDMRDWCSDMFNLFMVHWALVTLLNLLLAYDCDLRSARIKDTFGFIVGLLLGVNAVILLEYVRGVFVPGQSSSLTLTGIYYGLILLGVVSWFIVILVVIKFREQVREQNREKNKRLEFIRGMQDVQYDSVDNTAEKTCSICLEEFKAQDMVLQLKCHPSHIFHRTCIGHWVATSLLQCPLCKQNIS